MTLGTTNIKLHHPTYAYVCQVIYSFIFSDQNILHISLTTTHATCMAYFIRFKLIVATHLMKSKQFSSAMLLHTLISMYSSHLHSGPNMFYSTLLVLEVYQNQSQYCTVLLSYLKHHISCNPSPGSSVLLNTLRTGF